MRIAPLTFAAVVVTTPALAAANPAISSRGTVGIAGGLGGNEHAADGGMMGGVHLDLGFQLGWATVGAAIGVDAYGDSGGAPITSTTLAARLGIAPRIARRVMPQRTLELFVTAALEVGRHIYDPRGRKRSFSDRR